MYSGGWTISEARKSVNLPPHIAGTDQQHKKPLFIGVFVRQTPKTEQKQEQPKANKTGTSHGIRPEPEPPASRRSFLPVFRPCLDPSRQSFIGRFFAFVLSRPHSRSATSPHKPAQASLQASRPQYRHMIPPT